MVIARNLILEIRIPDIEYSWLACRFKLRSTESNCKNFVDAKSQDDKCPWFRYMACGWPTVIGRMEFLLVDNKYHSFYVTSRQSVKSFFRQERQHWWISEERSGRFMSCPKGMLRIWWRSNIRRGHHVILAFSPPDREKKTDHRHRHLLILSTIPSDLVNEELCLKPPSVQRLLGLCGGI